MTCDQRPLHLKQAPGVDGRGLYLTSCFAMLADSGSKTVENHLPDAAVHQTWQTGATGDTPQARVLQSSPFRSFHKEL